MKSQKEKYEYFSFCDICAFCGIIYIYQCSYLCEPIFVVRKFSYRE